MTKRGTLSMTLSDDKWYIIGKINGICCLVHFGKNKFYNNALGKPYIGENHLNKDFYISMHVKEVSEEQVALHFLANGVCFDGNKTGS
jgi:hypothetical protein